MRKFLALLFAATALSGCSGEDASGDGPATTDPNLLGNATAPAPQHWSGDILAGVDPFNTLPTDPNNPASLTGPPPCSQDVSSCEYHEFTVNGSFELTATLAWGINGNDLDLYLYQGNTQISQDGINQLGAVPPVPPGADDLVPTQQVMQASVPAGTYTFWVVIWNGAADSYTLDAEFA